MKYIKSILRNNKFLVSLKLKFENTGEFEMKAILDTGCQHSHISIDNIFIYLSDDDIKRDKQKYMNIRPVALGLGVESQNKDVNMNKSDVNNPRIIIQHRMYDVKVNDILIGNGYLNVSYDTSRVALIGMSIMKDWDIHIGKNKHGEIVFIGCPYNQLNQEYYLALENEFGINENINAAIVHYQSIIV